ncbi:hypothetical protein LOTGIDRAFT_234407 [Lottia gigantea]|uniref:TNase-like domain-containing protein n=1 Tax=Lottia gigantea TaxID=225164 RepID=V3ZCL9_LOTGI|nr:hypothetical protein LOTGIDRAFT_234407 [Lottia gigantea]ESO88823.1 hypothetical protein LOTGIDRAFT_234407 [Lottia gigantea]
MALSKEDKQQSGCLHNSDSIIASSKPNRGFILNFIDGHIKEIQWMLYGVGAIAAVLIIRDIYATILLKFKQFKKASEIPDLFIRKNVTLQGKVISVRAEDDISGKIPVLLTKHQQLLRTPSFLKKDANELNYLPVVLAGICSSPSVLSWLDIHVKHQHIWFKMLERGDGRIDSVVSFRKGWRKVRINEELIKKGIGQVYHYDKLPLNKPFESFILKLLKLESHAVHRGTGMWKEDLPDYWTRISKWCKSQCHRMFKKRKR